MKPSAADGVEQERMRAKNLLIIMSDQHSRGMLGCYGDPARAHAEPGSAGGARHALHRPAGPRRRSAFRRAPSFATGKYIHQIGFWDNADPYDGSIPSWHHRLRDGRPSASSRSASSTSAPMTTTAAFRNRSFRCRWSREKATCSASSATICRCAAPPTRWRAWPGPASRPTPNTIARSPRARRSGCAKRRSKYRDKPWVLFVSFVAPHYPLTAPPEHFYRYFDDPKLPMPLFYAAARAARASIRSRLRSGFQFRRLFRDAGRCAPRRRRLLRALQLHGRAGRQGARCAASFGLGGRYPRHLHERSRRCGRQARAVGKVDALRGDGGSAADRRRRRHPAGPCDRYGRPISSTFIRSSSIASAKASAGMIEPDHPGVSIARLANGERAGSHGVERISRHGFDHGRVRDPTRPVQIRSLREISAATVRSRERSSRSAGSCRPIRATARHWRNAKRNCASCSRPKRSMRERKSGRPSSWKSTAGAQR